MKRRIAVGSLVCLFFALSTSLTLAEDLPQAEIQDLAPSMIEGKAILLDGIHGTFGTNLNTWFGDFITELTVRGATVHTLNMTEHPITPDLLANYNALIVFEPGTGGGVPYTSDEKAAVEAWATSCGDLFVIGNGSPGALTNWVSFAGISFVAGTYTGGVTSDITSHCITTNVGSVLFNDGSAYLNVSSPAVSLVRMGGWTEVAAAQLPGGAGRVVALSDEQVIRWLYYNQNLQLALNAIDCGPMCLDCGGCMSSPPGNHMHSAWRYLPGLLLCGAPLVCIWLMKRRMKNR